VIKVDRGLVEAPAALSGEVAEQRLRVAKEFFTTPEARRMQKRFDFSLQFAQPALRERLREIFRDKCGYCEKPVSFERSGTAYLDRFRPTWGAIGSNGEVSADAYWWLAFEWDNMYACCAQCNRAKGSRFPIQGARARPGVKGAALYKEKALLLDPCTDDPETHLLYDETTGHVSGKTLKGRTTVEVFALNRAELLKLRMAEAGSFAKTLADVSQAVPSTLLDASVPFAGLRRQMAARHSGSGTGPTPMDHDRARRAQEQLKATHSAYDLSDPTTDARQARAITRYVEHVSLKNVGIHENTEFSIPSADSAGAPWMVLLGENGVGKSTVLKAIAFALAGQAQWKRLGPFAQTLLPLGRSPSEQIGEITLRLSDGEPISMVIDPTVKRITGNANDSRLFVLGFGATRLPANELHRPPDEPSYARVVNIFDPFAPLGDAVAWLCTLSDVQFERAGRTLKSLLDLPDEAVFVLKEDSVALLEGGLEKDIKTLSDGYQTIIGVGCDIMSVLLGRDLPVEHAEGIVLIDEIGNHLHPTWRMRIVTALKKGFPRVQFIATTHEPLCLRGLDNDEVVVLKRDKSSRVRLISDLPPIRGLLVDQILSSSHFGLRSTVDPEFAAQLDEYYELIAKPEPSPDDETRIQALAPLVNNLRLVGDNPREQILLRAIDAYLARADASAEAVDPANLPKEFGDELKALLDATDGAPSQDVPGVVQ
jgi:energy-coupling factor transporter ATP-binding protein EcfA2